MTYRTAIEILVDSAVDKLGQMTLTGVRPRRAGRHPTYHASSEKRPDIVHGEVNFETEQEVGTGRSGRVIAHADGDGRPDAPLSGVPGRFSCRPAGPDLSR
jgi:hypothetical protein